MMTNTITMIDYGGSNLRSAQKALEHVGATVDVTSDPDVVRRADRLVLPGVGAFGAGMEALRGRGLDESTIEAARRGVPLLGICLGMQYLFESSEEMGAHRGLGLLAGDVRRFPALVDADGRSLKVPHMGWNEIVRDGRHPLLQGVASGARAYFVHSYYCAPADPADVVAMTDYGLSFCSIAGRGNIYGIQFHPEKSQLVGLHILRNFVTMR